MERLEELLTTWYNESLAFTPRVILAIVVFLVIYYIAKSARKMCLRFFLRIKGTQETADVLSSIVYFAIMIVAIFATLEVLGLESVLTKLIAGAGIVGIIAGFAFKDIASNAFSGLILHFQRPFKVGNWVEIGDTYGTIQTIGWMTTSIRTVLGQEVFIPNQLIYSNAFKNYSAFNRRRVVLSSGVSYGDDLEHVKKVAIDEVSKIQNRLEHEPIDFYFTSIGSSSYNFEVRYWIAFHHQTDFLNAQHEVITRIKKRFEQEDISLAYSVLTLDFGAKGGLGLFDQPIEIKKD